MGELAQYASLQQQLVLKSFTLFPFSCKKDVCKSILVSNGSIGQTVSRHNFFFFAKKNSVETLVIIMNTNPKWEKFIREGELRLQYYKQHNIYVWFNL